MWGWGGEGERRQAPSGRHGRSLAQFHFQSGLQNIDLSREGTLRVLPYCENCGIAPGGRGRYSATYPGTEGRERWTGYAVATTTGISDMCWQQIE